MTVSPHDKIPASAGVDWQSPPQRSPTVGLQHRRNIGPAILKTVLFADTPYQPNGMDELIPVDCTGGAITIALPPASANPYDTISVTPLIPAYVVGRRYYIYKADASGNAVTIAPATWGAGTVTDTINGATASLTISTRFNAIEIVCVAGTEGLTAGAWVAWTRAHA